VNILVLSRRHIVFKTAGHKNKNFKGTKRPSKVGVISDSQKISDSIPRICRNDASKLAPSHHSRHDPRLTAREIGRPDSLATIKITWCNGKQWKQTSNFKWRYGVTKSLWESRYTSTLMINNAGGRREIYFTSANRRENRPVFIDL
jgi:hypothetical protein